MTVFLIFLLAGVGTYLIRISGIVLLGDRRDLPPRVTKALSLVAPAAMAAIIANALLLEGQEWRGFGAWHLAGVVAIALAVWKRSMGWAFVGGTVVFAGLLLAGL